MRSRIIIAFLSFSLGMIIWTCSPLEPQRSVKTNQQSTETNTNLTNTDSTNTNFTNTDSTNTNFTNTDSTNTNEPPEPAKLSPWVYFIGNSITYVYDIPGRFHRLVMANGGYPEGYQGYKQHTPGAYTLKRRVGQLAENDVIMDILYQKPRYIVLQEQSAGIYLIGSGNDTYNQIPKYLAIALASQSELIIYQTWHNDNPEDFLKLSTRYRLGMAPNGEIFNQLNGTTNSQGVTNYLTYDYTHQNELGASLYAASFFYLLNPHLSKIPGLIAQTGYSLLSADENHYNQVVFDSVRNPNNSTTLRGITTTTNIYNGVIIQDTGLLNSDLVTNYDDEGNSLEDPIVLVGGEQTFDVDIPSYDIDIYQLPTELAGQTITVSFSNVKYVDWEGEVPLSNSFYNNNWKNSIFLGDANGKALNHTLNGGNIRLTVPSIPAYLGFIGGGIHISSLFENRPAADGQFTVIINVD